MIEQFLQLRAYKQKRRESQAKLAICSKTCDCNVSRCDTQKRERSAKKKNQISRNTFNGYASKLSKRFQGSLASIDNDLGKILWRGSNLCDRPRHGPCHMPCARYILTFVTRLVKKLLPWRRRSDITVDHHVSLHSRHSLYSRDCQNY